MKAMSLFFFPAIQTQPKELNRKVHFPSNLIFVV